MTVEPKITLSLQFLVRIVRKECQRRATPDQRLFGSLFTLAYANQLEADPDLAERVEAFVGRFGRLQDAVGDKLLPLLRATLGGKHPPQSTTLTEPNAWGCSTPLANG